ncbi:MAG: 4-hydroxythreonine-4-phosphate dehydrogenase PdxA, partial [Spirochaetes bacterium]|nr:4-hydroxythreonine-4-phosphate dehydrogenase PdxA [Spirochaetota bacterium]
RNFLPARNIRIGITLGDPAGVGPEIIEKALHKVYLRNAHFVIIARSTILFTYYPQLAKLLTPVSHSELSTKSDGNSESKFYIFDVTNDFPIPQLGRGTILTGAESLQYIDTAIELWKRGLIDAIVTAPVSKSLIEKSGTRFSGHTEYFAEKIGEKNPVMMMFSEKYRVILCTTHLPVSKVENQLTIEKIVHTIVVGNNAIKAIDGIAPKVAVCGLDPHCGDDGAISTFDREITTRAVDEARKQKINVSGPYAADTLFMSPHWEKYDLVVAMYHDQGLIPFKMRAFDRGVNVTLGLSLIRTSVDHGTAFDIAGKQMANPTSMIEAISLAAKLATEK